MFFSFQFFPSPITMGAVHCLKSASRYGTPGAETQRPPVSPWPSFPSYIVARRESLPHGFDHVTPSLQSISWFPIARMNYELLTQHKFFLKSGFGVCLRSSAFPSPLSAFHPLSKPNHHPWRSQSAVFCFVTLFVFLFPEVFVSLFKPDFKLPPSFHPCLNVRFLTMPSSFPPWPKL